MKKDKVMSVDVIKSKGLNAFLNYASIGILLVDRAGKILIANNFVNSMFLFEEDELIGVNLEVLVPYRFKAAHVNHHKSYYHNPQSRPMGLGMDLFGLKKNGMEFPIEVSLGTYEVQDETYVIAFINDISVRKENEQSIKKLNAELEKKVTERTEALADAIVKLQNQIKETENTEKELAFSLAKEKELNELKSRFVSMASHEFRTPLSTILSSAYLLQQYSSSEDQPKRDKHIDRILSSVNTLNDILEELLSVGKIEEGKVTIKLETLDITELVNSIIHQFQPILKQGQHIKLQHTGDVNLVTDKSMLKHIINNLISNAVKFSESHSEILITIINTSLRWSLAVKDQGIGIPAEDQNKLFERFYRASNVSMIKGTGLGLHIVSKYVELLKGSLSFISKENEGTEFIINFNKK